MHNPFGRLQRKVLLVILTLVVVPMLLAGAFAAEWVSSYFEKRLEQWIKDAARVDYTWLKAYQNDATMLGGILGDEPDFLPQLDRGDAPDLDTRLRRIAAELGIAFIQVYTLQHGLLFSSTPIRIAPLWEHGQTQAVVKVLERRRGRLAVIGITPVPKQAPRYYLVLGSLLNQDFIDELSQLTGLKTRLYYREGRHYLDVFSKPNRVYELRNLPRGAMRQLEHDKKPYYEVQAEGGKFRGLYTPIVDSTGRVEAIMFSGLERSGMVEVLTNRVVLFVAISFLGVVLGGLTGLFISRLVLRPIEHLRNGVLQLARQDFNAAVPISSNDELGDLAQAFNAMAARLRSARDEQQQRFQQDKLAALGKLSAALAHEIRNPVAVINTACTLLEKPDQPEEKRRELVRMMREESRRVGNLVGDFLQYSRPRAPEPALIDPTAPLERALAGALAGRDDVEVVRDYAHGEARARVDASHMQQVWTNLFTNAIEALGPRRGHLYLQTELDGDEVLVSVEDSGPGIDAAILPRLFEPFFTTKPQGTGLGLSIARALAEVNGGRLELLPSEHGGARLGVRLPAQTAEVLA